MHALLRSIAAPRIVVLDVSTRHLELGQEKEKGERFERLVGWFALMSLRGSSPALRSCGERAGDSFCST